MERDYMKHRNTLIVTGCIGALFALARVAPSQQTPPPPGQPQVAPGGAPAGQPGGRGGGFGRGGQPFDYADNEGWVSLFDGQTLNGWDGDPRFWSVKDGAIYVEPTCEKPTGTIYLVWQGGEPGDFMLKFESKGTGQVNGGIQYRSYMTADSNVVLKYPGRGGGGTLANANAGRGNPGAGRGPGAPGGGGRGPGRGPQCANPGTPPSMAERAKWDMAGPQFDFDAGNMYPGQYYEQLGRGIAAAPGTVVVAEPGVRRVLATIADKETRDSWFKKDDYNQFLLVAKGNTHSMYMNGHLISVFIDNDPTYFRASGKIGVEVESTGAYYTRNLWLKRM
jgi:Domain of Unknown Function (DUF1080)